jgi:hypothetical protein
MSAAGPGGDTPIKDLTLSATPPATQLPIATLREWKKRDRVLNDSGINSMITSRPLWEPGRACA